MKYTTRSVEEIQTTLANWKGNKLSDFNHGFIRALEWVLIPDEEPKQEPIEELVDKEVESDPSVRTLKQWKEPDLYDAVAKINELVRAVNAMRDKE